MADLDKSRMGALTGLGIGASLMYFLDPERGARRRALVRDQAVHGVHKAQDLLDAASRDLSHRTTGAVARARSALRHEKVEDDVLVGRVRAKLGRYVSHPHAIEATAKDGRLTLRGYILSEELRPMLVALAALPGIEEIENRLEAHLTAERIPSLQGGTVRLGERFDLFQSNWSPTTRIIAGSLALGALVSGIARRGFSGSLLASSGLLLGLRVAYNREFRALVGLSRELIHVHKTIQVSAPIETVFEFWSNLENFPQFMSDIREVKLSGDGRFSHWVIEGPAGAGIGFDAETILYEPNRLCAWRSRPGSKIEHEGQVRFTETADGETRIDLDFRYVPPVGVIGDLGARLFGLDPKAKIEAGLAQIKTLLEQGPSRRQIRGLHSGGRR